MRRALHRALFAELDRYLLATRPTHIACTHYLPALAAARVAPRIGARTLVTITDHAPHRAWLVPGIDAYAVADAAVARAVARRTAGAAEVWETGIPIARAAGAPVRAVAAELARPRVLALLGGVPRHALAALDALAPLASSHALHVLTGDDADVCAHAARVLPGAERAPRANGLLAAIDAADVVVSKAGGLTVSECLARGRALVLPFAAPGQERGNRDYACAAGAAVRPLEVADLGAVIAALGAEPGALRRMGTRARLASHPHAAAEAARALRGRAAREHAAPAVKHAA
jgi:processive 1,2-diacylglycerol beta-glucosyltransferase